MFFKIKYRGKYRYLNNNQNLHGDQHLHDIQLLLVVMHAVDRCYGADSS